MATDLRIKVDPWLKASKNRPLVTRGISASSLIESELWLLRPRFLTENMKLISHMQLNPKANISDQLQDERISHTLVSAQESFGQVVDTDIGQPGKI